ncbi:hypothetical protein A0128_05020 [Leptospira tipperaryensis]|uniref:Knr4/Smi1-like domain-containing protein n=1 Tax=Leptospira tipperaryensis TaxID=2564040 RepID=A0A1D7UUK8_9LEPT|nr:SMI1/KNR4 family protein [Leptospira tipperaryensis]AOP33265.1 hypothetical protein A0128_05020 [Leptospira tipperaryensis]
MRTSHSISKIFASLKELYSYTDGQKENHTQLFNNFYFMSSDNCLETKRSLDEQAIEEGWKETWFPFGEDGMGQY